jgi:SAM-dependent methyltransferase
MRDEPEFDRYAGSYSDLLDDPIRNQFAQDTLHFHKRKWDVLERLLNRSGKSPSTMAWLDVGCGGGDFLGVAGDKFAHATGCDPSADMLARSAAFEVHQQSSPTYLPFESQSFDIVTAVCVYHHVHGNDRTLIADEISRVLRPSGFCCIIEHNPWNPVTRSIVKRCPVDIDAELLSASSTRSIFKQSGFKAISTDYFLYLPENLYFYFGQAESLLRKIPLGGQYAAMMQTRA